MQSAFSIFNVTPKSDSAGYLAGTEAPSTYVDMAGSTFDQSLYTTYIRLPGSIGTTMRVRDLNAERNALIAELALCHPLHLLAVA